MGLGVRILKLIIVKLTFCIQILTMHIKFKYSIIKIDVSSICRSNNIFYLMMRNIILESPGVYIYIYIYTWVGA